MRKTKCSRLCKKMATLAIALVMILSCSFSAMAATRSTAVHIGTGQANLGDGIVYYVVTAQLYYTENTATRLGIESMAQWIYNFGTQPINETYFHAYDSLATNSTSWPVDCSITAGNNQRIEVNWYGVCLHLGRSHVYPKNGSYYTAHTSMVAGYDGGVYSTWDSLWYPTRVDSEFYFN